MQANELPSVDELEREVSQEERGAHGERVAAEEAHLVEHAIDLAMQERSDAHVEAAPDEASRHVEGDEAAIAHAHRGQGRNRDRRDAGNEFREEEQRGPVASEHVVGAAHADVGREGDAANGLQELAPVPAPEEEPRMVRDERGGECGEQHVFGAQRAADGEPARDDDPGGRPNGKACELQQHHAEYERNAPVIQQPDDVHAGIVPESMWTPPEGTPRCFLAANSSRLAASHLYLQQKESVMNRPRITLMSSAFILAGTATAASATIVYRDVYVEPAPVVRVEPVTTREVYSLDNGQLAYTTFDSSRVVTYDTPRVVE